MTRATKERKDATTIDFTVLIMTSPSWAAAFQQRPIDAQATAQQASVACMRACVRGGGGGVVPVPVRKPHCEGIATTLLLCPKNKLCSSTSLFPSSTRMHSKSSLSARTSREREEVLRLHCVGASMRQCVSALLPCPYVNERAKFDTDQPTNRPTKTRSSFVVCSIGGGAPRRKTVGGACERGNRWVGG